MLLPVPFRQPPLCLVYQCSICLAADLENGCLAHTARLPVAGPTAGKRRTSYVQDGIVRLPVSLHLRLWHTERPPHQCAEFRSQRRRPCLGCWSVTRRDTPPREATAPRGQGHPTLGCRPRGAVGVYNQGCPHIVYVAAITWPAAPALNSRQAQNQQITQLGSKCKVPGVLQASTADALLPDTWDNNGRRTRRGVSSHKSNPQSLYRV